MFYDNPRYTGNLLGGFYGKWEGEIWGKKKKQRNREREKEKTFKCG